jgi:hypothetical protein
MHVGYWWEGQKEKRPPGRPRRRWVDNIKMDLRNIGWGGMDWIDMAQNMDQWRALVNVGKFLSSCTTGVFTRRTQLHGVIYSLFNFRPLYLRCKRQAKLSLCTQREWSHIIIHDDLFFPGTAYLTIRAILFLWLWLLEQCSFISTFSRAGRSNKQWLEPV